MADIVLINPRFEVSYWGLEHAMPFLGIKAVLPVANLPNSLVRKDSLVEEEGFEPSVPPGSPSTSSADNTSSPCTVKSPMVIDGIRRRKSGSQQTLRWRKRDSNPRSPYEGPWFRECRSVPPPRPGTSLRHTRDAGREGDLDCWAPEDRSRRCSR